MIGTTLKSQLTVPLERHVTFSFNSKDTAVFTDDDDDDVFSEATFTEEELAILLRDRTFVDYFNVFLSLPIFSQRIRYKFSENDFDFDPPIRRTQYHLDSRHVVKWLLSERVPFFLESNIYLEYCLNKELAKTELHLTPSSHNPKYEEDKQRKTAVLVEKAIGHVSGMRKLRRFLRGSVGEKIVNFWMDAERHSRISVHDRDLIRASVRDIQAKYFRNGARFEFPEYGKWLRFLEMVDKDPVSKLRQNPVSPTTNGKNPVLSRLQSTSTTSGSVDYSPQYFNILQNMVMDVLHNYWIPRYILHCWHHSKEEIAKFSDLKDIDLLNIANPELTSALDAGALADYIPKERVKLLKLNAMFPKLKEKYSLLRNLLASVDKSVPLATDCSLELPPSPTDDSCTDETSPRTNSPDKKSRTESPLIESPRLSPTKQTSQVSPTPADGRPRSRRRSSAARSPALEEDEDGRKLSPSPEGQTRRRSSAVRRSPASPADDIDERSASPLTTTNLMKHDSNDTLPSPTSKSRRRRSSASPFAADDEIIKERKVSDQKVSEWLQGSNRRSSSARTPSREEQLRGPRLQSASAASGRRMSLSPGLMQPISAVGWETPTDPYLKPFYPNLPLRCSVQHYRYENRILFASITSDEMAGQPFERFVTRFQRRSNAMRYLKYFKETMKLLSLSNNEIDILGEKQRVRKGRNIVMQYLHQDGEFHIDFGDNVQEELFQHISDDSGIEFVRQSQNLACEYLRGAWKAFLKLGYQKFVRAALVPKMKGTKHRYSIDLSGNVQIIKRARGRTQTPDVIVEERQAGIQHARNNLALELTADIVGCAEVTLDINLLQTFSLDNDEGSLWIKEQLVHRQPYIRRMIGPEKLDIESIRVSMDDLYNEDDIKRLKDMTEEVLDEQVIVIDTTPAYMKPLKKNGIVHERPPKPRNLLEVLHDPIHIEFFRRWLVSDYVEGPLLFWLAVDDMRQTKEVRDRNTKIQYILKRFFTRTAGKGTGLECDAEIIKEIPNMDRVTTSVLIAAQLAVLKSMEDKFWPDYEATFGETIETKTSTEKIKVEEEKRRWSKEKTKALWINFVRGVATFRRGILNPFTAEIFRDYLKNKIAVDPEIHGAGTAVASSPNRRVIRNRVVHLEKLTSDLNFLIEVEKYRQLVDNANASLAAGNFTSADEYLVKSKARTIINCFIDSELPPKVQVNVPNEIAEAILADYRHSTMDRGLFHDATVNIFTILSYLWSRFLHHRVALLVGKVEDELHISPHHMDAIPDYFNIDTTNVKKVLVSGDEEGSRYSFSLRYGLRQIISPAAHRAHTPGGSLLPDHAGRRASNYARSRQSIISHGRRESFYLEASPSSASVSTSSRRRLSLGTSRLTDGRRRGTLKRIDDQESSTADDSSDSATVPSSEKTGGTKMSVLLKLIDGDVLSFSDK